VPAWSGRCFEVPREARTQKLDDGNYGRLRRTGQRRKCRACLHEHAACAFVLCLLPLVWTGWERLAVHAQNVETAKGADGGLAIS
jgi:hypothetical protein